VNTFKSLPSSLFYGSNIELLGYEICTNNQIFSKDCNVTSNVQQTQLLTNNFKLNNLSNTVDVNVLSVLRCVNIW
jgi:hypothetical protein